MYRAYYPMYFDPTYLLVIVGVLLCMLASARVRTTYAKYERVRNHSGMTGRDAAERILRGAGIFDVRIERVSGHLTDHYDPRNKVLRLSVRIVQHRLLQLVWQRTSADMPSSTRSDMHLLTSEVHLFQWQTLDRLSHGR